MRTSAPSDRRAEIEHDLAPRAPFAMRISRQHAWIFVALWVFITGIADWWTGHDTWFGPIYLVAIGIAAWSLGWREAIGIGLASVAISVSVNGSGLYPYGNASSVWNLVMRLLAVAMIVGLMHFTRTSYAREWCRARTDALTGAFNRQAFFELAEAARHSRKWSLLAYADLDGLKQLNDEQGHEVGDQCLMAFAAHVKKTIRKNDLFARIGGDEFLTYMIVRDEAAGKAVAARLHREMNRAASQIASGVKCSVGVLILPPGARSLAQEVRLADELMYDAKQHGAALAVATAYERDGSIFVMRHWELSQTLDSDQPPQPAQGKLDLGDRDAAVHEVPPPVTEAKEVRLRPSSKAAA